MTDLLMLRAIRGRARTLNLNGKRLQRVPGAVGDLPQLTALHLKNNALCQLPGELTILNLGNNQFTKVPEELKYLHSLQILHMFGNGITEIPPCVFDGLQNLLCLNLNNNLIENLPVEIQKLQCLEKLSINKNCLQEIPRELCILQNLSELHLGNNRLETLPEQIAYLSNLKELRIYRNHLIGLPEGLCRLKKLKILDVAGNQIQAFPSRMHEVPIQELYCEENPLLRKEPVSAIQDEEMLSLKEITARLILSHLQNRSSLLLREQIKYYPDARRLLSRRNVCALCGKWFLDMWLECVKFVDVKKKMKTSSNLQLLPVRLFLCSYQCFNQRHSDVFGVAVQ
ncbi:leucine-rich repeat-containing protein 69 isoform X2 [Hyla sarda]|uniref:leucine-rich repeat-containing protein 69 isoform X2 n=1 Tax=Hyla sarda TaxID=327740 RepID=UPI0024C45A61|nr:leucine-rich repeat-containing protein 69 isoform X2 [Hyla sarda]